MGYWDNYEEPKGGKFITGDEKKKLVNKPFKVTSIRSERSPFTNDDGVNPERFVLSVEVDGVEGQLAFDQGSVMTRDTLLGDILKYQDTDGGELPMLVLEKAGRAWLVHIHRDEAAQF